MHDIRLFQIVISKPSCLEIYPDQITLQQNHKH